MEDERSLSVKSQAGDDQPQYFKEIKETNGDDMFNFKKLITALGGEYGERQHKGTHFTPKKPNKFRPNVKESSKSN